MRARANFAIDLVAAVIYVISTNPVATGTPAHEWVGIGVAFVALVHLVVHWRQAATMLRRFFHGLGRLHRLNLIVDVPLLIAFITVVMSGLLVSRTALEPLGWRVAETSIWHAVHSQSATVLLVLVGVHLGLHWSWILSAVRHRIFRPMLHPVATIAWAGGRARDARARGRTQGRHVLAGVVRHTVLATALVALLAAGIYGVTVATNGAYLASGLTMPGGSGTGLMAEAPGTGATDLTKSSEDVMRAQAAERGVSVLTLASIRSAHAFLLLGLALACAAAVADILRPVPGASVSRDRTRAGHSVTRKS